MVRAIKQIGRILTGFYLAIMNRNYEISKSRMRICIACDNRGNFRCKKCGCLLNLKTRVKDESCPLNKW